uniref:Uncharacterized protein n=1 Tax=Vitis vinifera TaxID=29760 RepID=F6HK81_VITVI
MHGIIAPHTPRICSHPLITPLAAITLSGYADVCTSHHGSSVFWTPSRLPFSSCRHGSPLHHDAGGGRLPLRLTRGWRDKRRREGLFELCPHWLWAWLLRVFGCTHTITVHFSRVLSAESCKSFTIGNPLGCRGSACVEVMTTLHGSAPSLWRRAEGCVPPRGAIASARDLLKSTHFLLEPP